MSVEDLKSWPAIRDVVHERQRQVSDEGFTPDHDSAYEDDQLIMAAICYAGAAAARKDYTQQELENNVPEPQWPWSKDWWKPTTRRRDLVKAAALLIAEIERIDRKGEE